MSADQPLPPLGNARSSRRGLVIFLVVLVEGLIVGSTLCWLVFFKAARFEPAAVAKPPIVQVLTTCRGLSAQAVEKTITRRIERWVNQAPGVDRVESRSMDGASVVTVYFRDDVDPSTALTTTNSLALSTLPTLPPNVLPPVVLPCHDSDPRKAEEILKALTGADASAERPRE